MGKVSGEYIDKITVAIKYAKEDKFINIPSLIYFKPTNISASSPDNIQIVECFNDSIFVHRFGQSLITFNINGFVLRNFFIEHLKQYDTVRKQEITVAVYGQIFRGLCRDHTFTVDAKSPSIVYVRLTISCVPITFEVKK